MRSGINMVMRNIVAEVRETEESRLNAFVRVHENEKLQQLKTDNESCKSCSNCIKRGFTDYCKLKKKSVKSYNICSKHKKAG